MFCSLVLSNKVKLSSLFYHYCIDEWILHVVYEYLVYEDFCGGVGQGHMTLWAIYAQFSKDQNSALKLLLLF